MMSKTKEYINNQFTQIAEICFNSAFHNTQVFTNLVAFAFIRRIDSLIENKTEKCEKFYESNKNTLSDERLSEGLKEIVEGLPFYNISGYSLSSILKSSTENIYFNLRTYIDGFSINVKNILYDLNFNNTISILSRRMYSLIKILDLLCSVDMSESGGFEYIDFTELIELLKEKFLGTNKSPYSYTSASLSSLMAECLLAEKINENSSVSVLDPVCGTGGLLITVGNNLLSRHGKKEVSLYGQDIDPVMVSITNALLLLSGKESSKAYSGNTLIEDCFKDMTFEYVIGDFPHRISWKGLETLIRYEEGFGRYSLGLPEISDSQFLFMQHMISKLKPSGGRMVTITSENALTGLGGNNIRRKMFDMDMVEAIISLPKQIYRSTDNRQLYLWVITNNKVSRRRGYVQLIDGNNISNADECHARTDNNYIIDRIVTEYCRFENTSHSYVSSVKSFLYYKVTLRNVENNIKRTVQIPADTDIFYYLNQVVYDYSSEKYSIDFDSINMGCSITFDRYFSGKFEPLSLDDSLKAVLDISNNITLLKNRIKKLENLPGYDNYKKVDSVFGKVPEHWKEYTLNSICKVIKGNTPSRLTDSKDGFPCIELSCQKNNIVGRNVFLSCLDSNEITDNDVIIVRNGTNAGKVFPGKNGILSKNLIALKPDSEIIPQFFYYLIKGHERLLMNKLKHNIIKVSDIDNFTEMRVYIPPKTEQLEIVELLDKIVIVTDNIISLLDNADNAFGRYRQAIIEKAVFGQIRML